MDITNSPAPASATHPHSAPSTWLCAPAPAPEPDEARREAMRYHMDELERLTRDLGHNRQYRGGGWTPENRRIFLGALADSGRVSFACECVDLSKQSAYALRARDPVFAAGWNAAAELARDALADAVLERALAGSTETITRNGEVVAERHKHDGRLAMAVLARLDRRCDRSAEEGGAHRRAMAEWDRFLALVGDGDEAAASELLDPPPPPQPAHDGQPSQLDADEEDNPVWYDEPSGEWRTSFPHPDDDESLWTDDDERPCTPEEAELLEAYFPPLPPAGDDESRTDRHASREAFFARVRAEMGEAKSNHPTPAPGCGTLLPCGPLASREECIMDTKRDPHSDNELIDEADELETPSQSGTSGGNMARSVSSRDEEKTATGEDPEPTGVHKGDKANEGASPLPRDRTDLG